MRNRRVVCVRFWSNKIPTEMLRRSLKRRHIKLFFSSIWETNRTSHFFIKSKYVVDVVGLLEDMDADRIEMHIAQTFSSTKTKLTWPYENYERR